MKAKKPLFLVMFVLLVVVLLLGITGLAVAAPATAVKGDVTFDEWVDWGTQTGDPATGPWVWSGVVIRWTLSGDLEGTYTLCATYSGNGSLASKITGTATFVGTLTRTGEPIVWSAIVNGSGKTDPAYFFAGRNYWKSTLVDGMKGQITIHQVYVYDPSIPIDDDNAVYWGELK
jgi:hypothetical protein